jgi:hypothetical protein
LAAAAQLEAVGRGQATFSIDIIGIFSNTTFGT